MSLFSFGRQRSSSAKSGAESAEAPHNSELSADVPVPENPERFRVISVCFAGTNHDRASIICQDSLKTVQTRGGGIAAAIADGASTANMASTAAACQTTAFISFFREQDLRSLECYSPENLSGRIINRCVRYIYEQNKAVRLHDLGHYSATLTGFVAEGSTLLVMQVGDGAVFGLTWDDKVEQLSTPDNIGEDKSRTVFVISADSKERCVCRTLSLDRYKGLMCMSDGPYNAFEQKGIIECVRSAFCSIIREGLSSTDLEAMLRSRFSDRERYDDWSLCVAIRGTTTATHDISGSAAETSCLAPDEDEAGSADAMPGTACVSAQAEPTGTRTLTEGANTLTQSLTDVVSAPDFPPKN